MFRYLISFVCFASVSAGASSIPHWDLDMTGEEYARLLQSRPVRVAVTDEQRDLDKILEVGKRSLEWLTFINNHRPVTEKISFSSAATQMGYPITTPGTSNPTIVQALYDTFWKEAPEWFSSVVLKGAAFTESLPVNDSEYVTWGLRLDRIYQKASRWILQEPMLSAYAARRKNDVRGYYYLGQYADLSGTLGQFSQLSEGERTQISDWMVGLCFNSSFSLANCRSEWNRLVAQNQPLLPYYNKYLAGGKKMWDSYFLITSKRSDVIWNATALDLMTVPFIRPADLSVERFLTDNIEDEWRLGAWQLRLKYQPDAFGTAHVEFVPGATPHVNGLAGSTITMDKNQPLTEYNVQWTIRHEFGHVLGLPDCYVEFYDQDKSMMINYQLDITNLMCSRKGHLKEIHHSELKKAYFK